jgi:hypothetical protein
VERRDFTDNQRKEMLRAIHEREGEWDRVDPDTEIANIGEGIGLSEEESFALFKLLVDEHYVYPGVSCRPGVLCRDARAGSSDVATTLRLLGTTCGLTTRGEPRSSSST